MDFLTLLARRCKLYTNALQLKLFRIFLFKIQYLCWLPLIVFQLFQNWILPSSSSNQEKCRVSNGQCLWKFAMKCVFRTLLDLNSTVFLSSTASRGRRYSYNPLAVFDDPTWLFSCSSFPVLAKRNYWNPKIKNATCQNYQLWMFSIASL